MVRKQLLRCASLDEKETGKEKWNRPLSFYRSKELFSGKIRLIHKQTHSNKATPLFGKSNHFKEVSEAANK